jgi:hypothetical protein
MSEAMGARPNNLFIAGGSSAPPVVPRVFSPELSVRSRSSGDKSTTSASGCRPQVRFDTAQSPFTHRLNIFDGESPKCDLLVMGGNRS